jgi:GTP cyclohydrolase I
VEDTLKNNITEFLKLVGEDTKREGLIDTPSRVAKMWGELLNPREFNLTVFDSNGYDQMIVERNIAFYTLCEHHIVPFFGTISIGYIPQKKIIGLSKLPRTVDYFCGRLNTQEYLTDNVANYLNDLLKPKGLGIVAKGRHLCQEMRGVKKRGEMITSSLKGIFVEDLNVKKEFLDLCVQ